MIRRIYVSLLVLGCAFAASPVLVSAQSLTPRIHADYNLQLEPGLGGLQSAHLTPGDEGSGAAVGASAAVYGTHDDMGLVIAGSVLLGVGYGYSVVIGALGGWPMFIPVVGGAVYMPLANNTTTGAALGIPSLLVQGTGLILLIIGLAADIPNDPPRTASLTPRLTSGPGELGAGMAWSF